MVTRLLVACSLMAVCVTVHAAGLTYALRRLRRLRCRRSVLYRSTAVRCHRGLDRHVAPRGDRSVGCRLRLGRRDARSTDGSLLQCRHLHDHRIRRRRAAEGVAPRQRRRSADRHPDVRMVHRFFLRDHEQAAPAERVRERTLTSEIPKLRRRSYFHAGSLEDASEEAVPLPRSRSTQAERREEDTASTTGPMKMPSRDQKRSAADHPCERRRRDRLAPPLRMEERAEDVVHRDED